MSKLKVYEKDLFGSDDISAIYTGKGFYLSYGKIYSSNGRKKALIISVDPDGHLINLKLNAREIKALKALLKAVGEI